MVQFIPTQGKLFEFEQMQDWIDKDPFHQDNTASWWLKADGILSAWIYDDKGPVMFMFAEDEGDWVRLHIQFGPTEEIGKLRIAKALMAIQPRFIDVMKELGKKGIAFKSISPLLIQFMKRQGFQDWKENDFLLKF